MRIIAIPGGIPKFTPNSLAHSADKNTQLGNRRRIADTGRGLPHAPQSRFAIPRSTKSCRLVALEPLWKALRIVFRFSATGNAKAKIPCSSVGLTSTGIPSNLASLMVIAGVSPATGSESYTTTPPGTKSSAHCSTKLVPGSRSLLILQAYATESLPPGEVRIAKHQPQQRRFPVLHRVWMWPRPLCPFSSTQEN